MKDTSGTFKLVLHKFKFASYIPEGVSNHIYKTKKNSLKQTLKILHEYNWIISLLLFVYFVSRKLGLKISLLYCKIALISTAVALSGSASYGVYQVIINSSKNKENIKEEIKKNPPINDVKPMNNKKAIPLASSVKLTINEIENSELNTPSHNISKKIYEALLKNNKMGLVVLNSPKVYQEVAPHTLIGRIYKLGESYVLTVKVVNSKNSTIKFSETVNFKINENIDEKIEALSKSISTIDSLW